jgi:hypothetical protein
MTMVAWIFLSSFWTHPRVVVGLYEVGERGDESEQRRYARGGHVVRRSGVPGTPTVQVYLY